MAIASGIFFEIVLMVHFSGIEVFEREVFNYDRAVIVVGSFPEGLGSDKLRLAVDGVYACTVLRAGVASLPVDRCWVDGHEEELYEIGERDTLRIICDLDCFSGVCKTGAYLLV